MPVYAETDERRIEQAHREINILYAQEEAASVRRAVAKFRALAATWNIADIRTEVPLSMDYIHQDRREIFRAFEGRPHQQLVAAYREFDLDAEVRKRAEPSMEQIGFAHTRHARAISSFSRWSKGGTAEPYEECHVTHLRPLTKAERFLPALHHAGKGIAALAAAGICVGVVATLLTSTSAIALTSLAAVVGGIAAAKAFRTAARNYNEKTLGLALSPLPEIPCYDSADIHTLRNRAQWSSLVRLRA